MAIQIMFDSANEVQSPTMVLANRNGKSIGAIIPKNLHYSESMNSYNEMSFDVYKVIDGVTCPHWSKIKDFKLVYCVEWDAYFEIYVETDESDETIKHIQGRSLAEAELSQIKVYDLEINTELDISRDDYKPTVIYSSDEEQSLMHKLLEKTPSFEIGHVDISIAKLQRTFTFNDKTVYDALQEVSEEVKCLFEFVSNKGENGKIQRIINIYDLSPFCGECGHRNVDGDICPEYSSNPTGHSSYNGRNIKSGYGEDTNIFVSKQNLTDEITYSSDVDSVKNCFKLTAGDDLMTATVRNCSPSKSGYLWHFTEDVISDMSDELRDIISQYKNAYEQYNTQFEPGDIEYDIDHTGEWSKIRSEYNSVSERYKPDYIAPDQFVNYLDMMNLYYDTIDLELYLRSGMMPTVTLDKIKAADHIVDFGSNFNLYLQTAEALSNLNKYTAENLIESFLKTIVNSAFQIKLTLDAFDTSVKRWVGSLKILSYLDDEDEASKNITVNFGVNEQEFTKQKLETSLAKTKSETPDVITLFNVGEGSYTETKFKSEIAKYGLTPLIRLRDAGQACLNILIEMGIAGNKASSFWVQSLLNQNNNLYNELYVPYYNRVKWLNKEIKTREEEIEKVVGRFNSSGNLISHGMMSYLEILISNLQEKLDLEGYIYSNTDNKEHALELLKELVSFRREDTYKNDNFISEGLDNAQIFARALEFVQEAEKDIKSAAVPVHTISSTLKNLLIMPEFRTIVKHFKVGNWIRAEIDSAIYKLRLIKYDIGFDDLDNIQVEFSDVQAVKDSTADIQSILNQASSIASNYSNIKIVSNNNKKSGEYVWEWVNDGLALTKVKIVDDADNQNIYWDENGFLCREYSPVLDAYEDKQLKIINKGLYVTDNNWRTTRAGIGNFIYYDPSEKDENRRYKESYGVIADTLVGNLILSKEVGIYNENNSVTIDKDGFSMIVKSSNNTNIFNIKKAVETGEETSYEDLFFVDNNGNLNIKGNIVANSLSLGKNGTFDLGFDLENYLTKDEASSSYVDSSGYSIDKDQIWDAINGITSDNTTNDLITKIGEFEDNAVFLAKPYGDIIQGYYYYGSFFKDSSYTTALTSEYNKYYLDVSTGQYYYCNGSSYSVSSAPQGYAFAVSTDGLLTAANAVISGTIYATAGEFIGTVKSGLVNYSGHYNLEASNGTIKIGYRGTNVDGSAKYAMTVNPDGSILFGDGVTLSWGSIPDAPTIPSGGNSSGGSGNTGNTSSGIDSELRAALGYGSNIIGSNYTISPYIYGGQLYIGNSDGTSYAQISNGILTAQGAVLKGSLYGDNLAGTSIPNFKVENGHVYAGYNSNTGNYNFIINPNGHVTIQGSLTIEGMGTSSGGNSSSNVYWDSILNKPDIYDRAGIVSIVEGTVTADFVNTKFLETGYIRSKNNTNTSFSSSNTMTGSFIDLNHGRANFGGKFIYDGTNLTVSGKINADSGVIGGWDISNDMGLYLQADQCAAFIRKPLGTTNQQRADSYFAWFMCLTDDGYTLGEFGINYRGEIGCMGLGSKGAIACSDDIYACVDTSSNNLLKLGHTHTSGSDTYYGLTRKIDGTEKHIINMRNNGAINIGCIYGDSSTFGKRVNIHTQELDLGYNSFTDNLYMSGYNIRMGTSDGTKATNLVTVNTKTFKWGTSTVATTSDLRAKYDINSFSNKHEKVFSLLKPVNYKYIDGTSGRIHFGFIAQDVRDAIEQSGLTTKDAAMFVSIPLDDGDEECALCYNEFISLNTHMIQKCLKEIDNLKLENNSLKQQLEEIKQAI